MRRADKKGFGNEFREALKKDIEHWPWLLFDFALDAATLFNIMKEKKDDQKREVFVKQEILKVIHG